MHATVQRQQFGISRNDAERAEWHRHMLGGHDWDRKWGTADEVPINSHFEVYTGGNCPYYIYGTKRIK